MLSNGVYLLLNKGDLTWFFASVDVDDVRSLWTRLKCHSTRQL